MGDILPFERPSVTVKHKGNTLCQNGHHKWQLSKNKQFDVKQGKLVTHYKCGRCGISKVKAH